MNEQYFALYTSPEGVPSELNGPGSWDACVQFIQNKTGNNDPENERLTDDGICEQPDGSTYYIVSASPM